MKYSFSLDNNTVVTFSSDVDVDLHNLDPKKPIVFNNVYVNMDHVVFIQKESEDDREAKELS